MKVSAADTVQMTVAERIRLVTEIWESIAQVPEQVEVSAQTLALLRDRLDEYRQNPTAVSPWSEVRARIANH